MRIVFMGSPAEVIRPLQSLMELDKRGIHALVAVVSQPARPAGRKRVLTDPPVAAFAKEAGLTVLQPEKARDAGFLDQLRALAPDVIITAAYGQILSEAFLAIPRRATINIHPSALPAYRGATPVPAALLAGDPVTAVSILFTVRALDAGALILQEPATIGSEETAGDLTERLFAVGAEMLPRALELLTNTDFKGTPQDAAQVTLCTKIEKTDGEADWQASAATLLCRFRAFQPWPGFYTHLGDKRILVTQARLGLTAPADLGREPGAFVFDKDTKAVLVRTGDGIFAILRLCPEGGKDMDATSFWNGTGSKGGRIFQGRLA